MKLREEWGGARTQRGSLVKKYLTNLEFRPLPAAREKAPVGNSLFLRYDLRLSLNFSLCLAPAVYSRCPLFLRLVFGGRWAPFLDQVARTRAPVAGACPLGALLDTAATFAQTSPKLAVGPPFSEGRGASVASFSFSTEIFFSKTYKIEVVKILSF